MTKRTAGPIPSTFAWSPVGVARHPYYVVDVFTAQPLEGNQLGVFVDGSPFSDLEMQRLAREMNFAETVFLFPPEDGGDVRARIFTPRTELPFAGHPVLGTAFVAGQALGLRTVRLEVPDGIVPIELERSGDQVVFGRMSQPIPVAQPYDHAGQMLAALGLSSSELPIELYANGPRHVFIKLPSVEAVAALKPDFSALAAMGEAANCFAGAGAVWKTRMFHPSIGVNEDPATGSAAGPLAIHLARHGEISFGDEITISQGEEVGRPSVLFARASGSAEKVTKVEVGGGARIVASGHYRIDNSLGASIGQLAAVRREG
jgi:trans-2,3-dihydro-3-hydroxyanthranilate isomerase